MPIRVHAGIYYPLMWSASLNSLDPGLLAAVVWAESGFNPHAVGDGGKSFGLGQLHVEGAGSGHKPSDLLDPGYNLAIAAAYLRLCLDQTPNPDAAISAYNQGIWGYQERGMGVNAQYVRNVLALWQRVSEAGIEAMPPGGAWFDEGQA